MAITRIQSGQGSGTSVTLGGAPAQGNLLIAVAVNNGSTPSAGTGWTSIDTLNNTQDGISCWKIAGAGESATQSPISGTSSEVYIIEWHSDQGWPANPIDVHSVKQAVAANPPTIVTNEVTPIRPNNGAVVVCYSATNADTAPASITGMNADLTLSGGAIGNGLAAYQLGVTTASAYSKNISWTGSTSSACCAFVIVFYENTEITLVQFGEVDASNSITLGQAPTQGNLMIAVAWKAASAPTVTSGWYSPQTNNSTPQSVLVAKFAGAGESTTQSPTTNGTELFFMEFACASGWSPVISNALAFTTEVRAAAASPPSVSTGALTIGGNNYVLVVVCLANNTSNTPPASITSMNNIKTIVGTSSIGNGLAAWQQPIVATTSKTCAWTGASSTASVVFAVVLQPGVYTQSVSGSITSAGARLGAIGKLISGSITDAGVALRAIVKNGLTASLTPAGVAIRGFFKNLAGSLGPTGDSIRRTLKAIAGSTGLSGTFGGRLVAKAVSGALAATGTLKKAIPKVLATASLAVTGAVVHISNIFLSGSLKPAGVRADTAIQKIVSGSVSTAGTIKRQAQKVFAASVAASVAVSKAIKTGLSPASLSATGYLAKTSIKSFVASLTPSGIRQVVTQKTLAATVSVTGTASRLVKVLKSASISISGAFNNSHTYLVVFNAVVGSSALVNKTIVKPITASIAASATYNKLIGAVKTASIALTAATNKAMSKFVSATESITGRFNQAFSRVFMAVLGPQGTETKSVLKRLTGQIGVQGVLLRSKTFFFTANASLALAASYKKMTGKSIQASIATSGAIGRVIAKVFQAAIRMLDNIVFNNFSHQAVTMTLAPVTAINLGGYSVVTADSLSLPVVSKIQLSLVPPGV